MTASPLIVSGYAALLALLFIALSVRTIRLRRRMRIAIGDAGDAQLLRAVRVHANFAEYVPLALLFLLLVEVGGAPAWGVHMLGVLLVAGRVVHAWGVSQPRENFRFRVAGMMTTFAVLLLAANVLLYRQLAAALA